MKLRVSLIFFLIITIVISQGTALADEWGPWDTPQSKSRIKHSGANPLGSAIKMFQKYISPVDGARCNMYPTCSAYALQAVEQHGPLIGTFIFVDRLYHEGDPAEHRHPINKFDYIRYYDPLENNTFWWD
jgi:uncharacterized protein